MRLRSIDVFRGMACLAVVATHSAMIFCEYNWSNYQNLFEKYLIRLMSFGFIGVGVQYFFVISGFGLAGACTRAVQSGTIFKYPIQRYKKIFPVFWIASASIIAIKFALHYTENTWLLESIRHPSPEITNIPLQGYITNLLLLESIFPSADTVAGISHYIVGVSWFLCYDLQFCLLIWLTYGYLRDKAVLFFASISILQMIALLATNLNLAKTMAGSILDGRLIIYSLGVITFHRLSSSRSRAWWIFDSILLAMAFIFFKQSGRVAFEIWSGSLFAIFLARIFPFDAGFATNKIWRPFQYVGSRSYSIYLIHGVIVLCIANAFLRFGIDTPIKTLIITIPTCILASIIVSEFFYRFVETKFQASPRTQRLQTNPPTENSHKRPSIT